MHPIQLDPKACFQAPCLVLNARYCHSIMCTCVALCAAQPVWRSGTWSSTASSAAWTPCRSAWAAAGHGAAAAAAHCIMATWKRCCCCCLFLRTAELRMNNSVRRCGVARRWLQAVKPAFSAEAEALEAELAGLYQQYLHRWVPVQYRQYSGTCTDGRRQVHAGALPGRRKRYFRRMGQNRMRHRVCLG